MFAFISTPILSILYCLSAMFLQILQNKHVMWTVTDAKFFAYFIDNVNFVNKLTYQDNYLHFCVNLWDAIQVFTPLIHLQLLYISSNTSIAQFAMSSHTVYSYTAQHNTTQYAHMYTNIQTEYSAVGIATPCWLGHPAIKSRRGRGFRHPSRPPLGPTQPPLK
jgi:hypothetical protein